MAEWSQMEEEKKAQLLDGVDRLVGAVHEQRVFGDQAETLRENFEMMRGCISIFKEEFPHEHKAWIADGRSFPPTELSMKRISFQRIPLEHALRRLFPCALRQSVV